LLTDVRKVTQFTLHTFVEMASSFSVQFMFICANGVLAAVQVAASQVLLLPTISKLYHSKRQVKMPFMIVLCWKY